MDKALPVIINIGGIERNLKFTSEAIRKTEAALPWKDITKIYENMSIPESCLVQILYFALEGGGAERLNITKVGKWKEAFVHENSRDTLVLKLICAIGASGILGNPTRFIELMQSQEETSEDSENEKND